MANVDSFRILDPESGQVYFDAFAPEFKMKDPVESLAASEIETNRLVSPLNKDLFIKSDSGLGMYGFKISQYQHFLVTSILKTIFIAILNVFTESSILFQIANFETAIFL